MIHHRMIAGTATILIAVTQSVHCQTIRGLVLEDSTSAAVPGAEIFLLDSLGNSLALEVTDRDGRFFMSPPPGRYAFRALRMGYAPTVTSDLLIPEGSPPIDLTILLPSEGVVLEPVVVEGERQPFAPGPLEGFYERKRRGWGLQLTREEIEEKVPGRFTDILRGLPGVRVVVTGQNKHIVQMVGQAPRLEPGAYNTHKPTGSSVIEKGKYAPGILPACPVSYYLDGAKYYPDERGIDEILVSDVEAVEVYRRASETPADFLDSDSRCGVVVIWTRRGE
jgi:hypothetical protein